MRIRNESTEGQYRPCYHVAFRGCLPIDADQYIIIGQLRYHRPAMPPTPQRPGPLSTKNLLWVSLTLFAIAGAILLRPRKHESTTAGPAPDSPHAPTTA